jgi:choline dehydrogenase-like flavoprotein
MLEHRGTSMQFRLKDNLGYNKLLHSMPRQLLTGARFLLEREGVMAVGGYDLVGFVKAKPEEDRPDTQLMFTPISTKATSLTSGKVEVDDKPGMMFLGYPLRPTSEGSIHIRGALPENPPVIRPNFLSSEHDRRSVIALTRKMREIMATSPIADLMVEETVPGSEVSSDEEILHNVVVNGANGYHTLGTCAMGPDDDQVVDSRLRVRGVEGLRVVDASVFPNMPSGNNNAPTQAAAWHGADLILEDHA